MRLEGTFWPQLGAIQEHFGAIFLAFSQSAGFGWLAFPLERNPRFCGLRASSRALVCLLVSMSVLIGDFNGFSLKCLDFWGLPWHPFGVL
jgi:hypothetical protein